ncbi:MAG: heme-binding domain-containing protein, partial [Tannerellaceae bacterium]|nr:heme-binding domain-containing protein [Tannerellaceae bacterium]
MTGRVLPAGALLLSLSLTNCTTEYKKYEGDLNKQVASIIRENGCLQCHSPETALPFYGKFPVIGVTVQADMTDGTRYLNLDGLLEALDKGGAILETDMAKMENTALTGSMPPFKYYAMPMHWGTKLSSDEKKTILLWAKETRKKYFASPTVAPEFANEPLQPLPASLPTDPAKVQLGYELFHDTRLSADNTISCASCHGLETGGVDRKQFSEGINGQFGGVNAPTVYNSALNFIQFWDGRAADLKEQAAGPPLNPVEMGHSSFDDIVANLAGDKEFTQRFTEVYPDGLLESNISEAIAEFEKTLRTTSRFDQYLR